jgi:hypothetical protein
MNIHITTSFNWILAGLWLFVTFGFLYLSYKIKNVWLAATLSAVVVALTFYGIFFDGNIELLRAYSILLLVLLFSYLIKELLALWLSKWNGQKAYKHLYNDED